MVFVCGLCMTVNKTRQVLAATSHNLESYHHSSAATEKPDVLQK